MSVFHSRTAVATSVSTPFAEAEALADTGTSYTLVPRSVLHRLGAEPTARRPFILADGHQAEYDIGEVRVRINGRSRFTTGAYTDEAATLLLGAVTLEELGLIVAPLNQNLDPGPVSLMASMNLPMSELQSKGEQNDPSGY